MQRFRKGAWKRKETKCRNCGGTKHNSRTCKNAPTSTRRQRTQARNTIDSDTDSSLNDQESDQETDSVDLQWQAELERYDEIIAQAHDLMERRRREELEDNDIISSSDDDGDGDSELSVLASSLFNGIEGIEMGGDGEVLSGTSGSRNTTTSPRTTRFGKIVKYQDE
jgi:hypothetical protein